MLAVGADGGCAVALREPLAVGAEDERQVGEHRRRGRERTVHQNLLWRVRQMIGAADHVGDAKVEVVGDHAEVVSGISVRAQQDKVLDLGIL